MQALMLLVLLHALAAARQLKLPNPAIICLAVAPAMQLLSMQAAVSIGSPSPWLAVVAAGRHSPTHCRSSQLRG